LDDFVEGAHDFLGGSLAVEAVELEDIWEVELD
jgi:hypothetical protein